MTSTPATRTCTGASTSAASSHSEDAAAVPGPPPPAQEPGAATRRVSLPLAGQGHVRGSVRAAEVVFDQLGAGLGRLAAPHQTPAAQDMAAIRDGQGAVDELLDEDDGNAQFDDALEAREHLLDDQRGQAEGDLVRYQQPRLAREHPSERQHLLLAARQRPRGLPPTLAEDREQLDRALDGCGAVSLGRAVELHLQVLLHGQGPENPAALGQVREAERPDPVGWGAGDIRAVEPDPP